MIDRAFKCLEVVATVVTAFCLSYIATLAWELFV
jgi:hypothetical protein